jgi:hypothetical protein
MSRIIGSTCLANASALRLIDVTPDTDAFARGGLSSLVAFRFAAANAALVRTLTKPASSSATATATIRVRKKRLVAPGGACGRSAKTTSTLPSSKVKRNRVSRVKRLSVATISLVPLCRLQCASALASSGRSPADRSQSP